MLKKLLLKRILLLAILAMGVNTWGQLTLTGTSYTQNFDGIGSGLPTGWTTRTPATSTTRGTVATLTTAATAWGDTGGAFKNFAAADGSLGSTASTANQAAATDRALGVRPSGSIGDPGASFELEILNTTGKTAFTLSLKHQLLDNQSRTQIYQLQYSTNGGTAWTTLGTNYTTASAFGSTTLTYDFGTALNNLSSTVYIRIVTLATSTGSGSRDSYGIDDFVLGWTPAAATPTAVTNAVGTITATTAVLNGTANAANGTDLATYFDYGTTTGYGSQVTATTPSSASGNTDTAFTGTATGLTPNTAYNYRAAGNNGTVYNGTNTTFTTLAAVPGAPVINGATLTSLSVTLDTATQNGNSAATTYAIQLTGNSLYVQANGSQGATAVWQTAAAWGTKVVTGLANNTQYTFHVKARNAASLETAFGASASGTTLANTSPTLTAGTITAFGAVCINTTTAAKEIIVNGENLTAADVVVGPLSGFSFSATSGGTYTPTLTFTQSGGSFIASAFVKFTPTAVQSYSGNIPVSGGGATTINVAASGSGIDTSPTVTTTAASAVTSTTATLGGNVTVEGCSPVTARGVVYATTTTPAIGGGGVTNLPAAAGGAGTYTVSATGLTAGVQYYARAYATNSNGATVYGSQVLFATVPVNDLCASASSLTVGAAAISGTLVGSTNTAFTSSGGTKDVWYTFTAGCTGSHTVTVSSFSGNVDVTLFPACPTNNSSNIGTAVSTSATTEVVTSNLTSGATYLVRVIAFNTAAETTGFTIAAASVSQLPTATAGAASGETYNSATVSGTVSVTGCSGTINSYGVEYSTTNGFADGAGTQKAGSNLSGGNFSVTITGLTPSTTYYYKVYANNNAGTAYSAQGSFTTGAYSIIAPVATAATNVTQSGFTANWQEVPAAESYRLDVSTSPTFGTSTPTTDLFFSEYLEGSSNNKYLEIYNGTGASVDLSNYQIRLFTNGASSASTTLTLSGTLANGATIVYRNSSSTIYGGTSTVAAVINHNGDDAYGLWKISSGAYVDIFGRIGEQPAGSWTSGAHSTVNKTLVRKATVVGGITVNPSSGFPTLESEWNVYNIDEVSYLGSHTYNGTTPNLLAGYNNKTVTGLSHAVTGLAGGTTYYYRVRAYAESTSSASSNTISVLTGDVKTWNGSAWSGNGMPPTIVDETVIAGNYTTGAAGQPAFSAATLSITSGTLTVSPSTFITVNGAINVTLPGAMIVQSNANVLQQDETPDANNGNVTIKRDSNPLVRFDYKLWSSPVAAQNLLGFSPDTDVSRFYIYNTTTNQYNAIVPSSNSFGKGEGYLIRMPWDHPTAPAVWEGEYTGEPYTGAMQVPVNYSATTGTGYNALGNPYMSPVDADVFLADNLLNIEGTLWFWRKTNGSTADTYVTYNAILGGNSTNTGLDEPNGVIQVGQGFLVNALPVATNVAFNNAQRMTDFNNQFYRQANTTIERHRVWINLTNAGGVFSQALIGYAAGATNGYDTAADSKYLATANAGLFTMLADTKLALQGRALPFVNTDVVSLGYKTVAAGNYTISIDHVDGLFTEGQVIYLKDLAAGVTHNLTQGAYTFASETGTFTGRFQVVYVNAALGTDDPSLNTAGIVAYKDGNNINVNAGTLQIKDLTVFDIRGRAVYAKQDINASEAVIANPTTEQQILIVKILTVDNVIVTKKIIF